MFQIDPGIAIIIGLALVAGGVVYFTHRRKADKPAAAAPVPGQAVPVATAPAAPSPAAPAPAAAAIVQLARAPDGTVTPVAVVAPAAPAIVAAAPAPGPAPAPEFVTHSDGSWWYVSKFGAEYGPCSTLADAQTLKAAIAVRDANEAKPSDDVARNGPIPIADATDQLNAAIKWVKYSVPGCSRIDEEIFGGASVDVKRNVQHLEYDLQAVPLASYQGPYRAQIDAYISARQNSQMQPPPIDPGPAPAPEFSTHADGTIWWRDPVRGVEMGPCASLNEAIELRNKVAARDWAQDPRNPESQQATADVPGVGFPVMAKAQVDAILANFDASIAAGHEDRAWYQLTSQEHFALQNRGMTRTEINAKIGQYN